MFQVFFGQRFVFPIIQVTKRIILLIDGFQAVHPLGFAICFGTNYNQTAHCAPAALASELNLKQT